jgi:diamine N-acetyltransferase
MPDGEGNVELRPLERDDLSLVAKWRRSPDATAAFFSPEPVTSSGQDSWYDSYLRDNTDMMFVFSDAELIPVGTIALVNIDYRNQKAEYARLLIGSPAYRGKGLARAASLRLLAFAHDQLHLTKIYLHVFRSNERAVSLYEKLGFEVEGRYRREVFSGGNWQDVIRMAVFLDGTKSGDHS